MNANSANAHLEEADFVTGISRVEGNVRGGLSLIPSPSYQCGETDELFYYDFSTFCSNL